MNNNAIIFIKNNEEIEISKTPYSGGNLLLHTIRELKKTQMIDDVYLVGYDQNFPGSIRRDSIAQVIDEIGVDGKTLLVSPLYPDLATEDYLKLLNKESPCVATYNGNVLEAFVIPNELLSNYENIKYEEVEIKNKEIRKFTYRDASMYSKQATLDDVIIFPLTRSEKLVKEVCNYLNLTPGKISVEHFADGETLVSIGQTVRGKRVYVIQSTSKPVNESLMELLIAVDALRRASAAEVTCVIPYYGYARQDRKAKPREPITAKLVASLLEQAGADRAVIFDLHATQIQGFFEIPVDELTAVPMMGQYFRRKNFDPDNVVVVSPDHGGVKRARNLAEMLECQIAIIDKRRPRPNVCEACNIIGDVEDKDVIIVDDIIDTGGSLIAASNLLREHGAKNIYVCVSHGIFSGNAITRIEDSSIKEVVVTNTIEIPKDHLDKSSKITVLSIGWMLSKLILAVSCHTAVTDVYSLYQDK